MELDELIALRTEITTGITPPPIHVILKKVVY